MIKAAEFASLGPAAKLGYMQGFASAIMPSDDVFMKVASKTGLDVGMVKAAYINKKALGPLGALAIGGGAGLALPALYHGIKNVLFGYRRPDEGKTPFHRDLRNQTMYNQQLSRDLQGIRGAFAPSENPFGKAGSLKKEAIGPWGMAGLGMGAGLMAPMAWRGVKGAFQGMFGGGSGQGGPGYQQPNQQLSPFHRDLRNQTMYNQMLSRDLQGIRGSFAPAANPFGGGGGY
jgi:hypothetical protein